MIKPIKNKRKPIIISIICIAILVTLLLILLPKYLLSPKDKVILAFSKLADELSHNDYLDTLSSYENGLKANCSIKIGSLDADRHEIPDIICGVSVDSSLKLTNSPRRLEADASINYMTLNIDKLHIFADESSLCLGTKELTPDAFALRTHKASYLFASLEYKENYARLCTSASLLADDMDVSLSQDHYTVTARGSLLKNFLTDLIRYRADYLFLYPLIIHMDDDTDYTLNVFLDKDYRPSSISFDTSLDSAASGHLIWTGKDNFCDNFSCDLHVLSSDCDLDITFIASSTMDNAARHSSHFTRHLAITDNITSASYEASAAGNISIEGDDIYLSLDELSLSRQDEPFNLCLICNVVITPFNELVEDFSGKKYYIFEMSKLELTTLFDTLKSKSSTYSLINLLL